MKKKKPALTSSEFDQRFDDGEDIHDLLNMSKAPSSIMAKRSESLLIWPNRLSKRLTKFGHALVLIVAPLSRSGCTKRYYLKNP